MTLVKLEGTLNVLFEKLRVIKVLSMFCFVKVMKQEPIKDHCSSVHPEEDTKEKFPLVGFDFIVVLFIPEVTIIECIDFIA